MLEPLFVFSNAFSKLREGFSILVRPDRTTRPVMLMKIKIMTFMIPNKFESRRETLVLKTTTDKH